MQKKSIIAGAVLIVSIVVGGVIWNTKAQKKKAEILDRVTTLTNESGSAKNELLQLYQKRYELLLSWQKTAGGKLPAQIQTPFKGELKTEQDLVALDQYQLAVSNQFTTLLSHPEIKKKSKDLEMIEHQMNKKRAAYHELGFEADELISKYKTGQAPIPVFPAEKLLHEMKK